MPVRNPEGCRRPSSTNVATALTAVGGSFDDVAKPTLHVVDRNESKLAVLGASRAGRRAAGALVR
jgi:hypothetical protein